MSRFALGLALLLSACNDLPKRVDDVKRRVVSSPSDEEVDEGSSTSILPDILPPKMDQACDDDAHTQDPVSANCFTETIGCEAKIEGHTQGGVNNWEAPFYRGHYCTPMPGDYSGPERVYRFEMPANTLAQVVLISPCEDLDLFAIPWSDTDRCPTAEHLISECEGDVKKGGGKVQLYTDHHAKTFLIGVDGKAAVTGAFRIETSCRTK